MSFKRVTQPAKYDEKFLIEVYTLLEELQTREIDKFIVSLLLSRSFELTLLLTEFWRFFPHI